MNKKLHGLGGRIWPFAAIRSVRNRPSAFVQKAAVELVQISTSLIAASGQKWSVIWWHIVRQWVLSFPFPLRFLFASRPEIMGRVLGIVYRVLSTHLIRKAGLRTRPPEPAPSHLSSASAAH